MTLEDILEICEYKIIEGSEHCWPIYENGWFVILGNDIARVEVIINRETRKIYEIDIYQPEEDDNVRPYRWMANDFRIKFFVECQKREVNPLQAYDDVNFIDLYYEPDVLQKTKTIWNGGVVDRRIVVDLDIPHDLFHDIALEAHRRDMTFNQYAEEILKQSICKYMEKVNAEDF